MKKWGRSLSDILPAKNKGYICHTRRCAPTYPPARCLVSDKAPDWYDGCLCNDPEGGGSGGPHEISSCFFTDKTCQAGTVQQGQKPDHG